MNNKYPLLNLFLYLKLKGKFGTNQKYYLGDFYSVIRRIIFRIPRRILYDVLTEMESQNLVVIHSQYIKVLKVNPKILKNIKINPLW